MQMLNLEYVRGDSDPIVFELWSLLDESAIDITGRTFLLTVDPEENPASPSGNLFQLTGAAITAADGTLQFPITTTQSNQTPGTYYYDIQMTTSSKLMTIAKGKFVIVQDITK